MKIEKLATSELLVTMNIEERNIIINCVNYLCHGNRPKSFDSLIGVEWEEAAKLLPVLNSV